MCRIIRVSAHFLRRTGFASLHGRASARTPAARRLLQPLDFDARHAPAIHFHDGKAVSAEIKTFSAARNESELREHETSQRGIGGIFRQSDVVLRFEIAKTQRGVKNHGRIRALADDQRLLHHIILIMNFADELLQNIFESNQSENACRIHRQPWPSSRGGSEAPGAIRWQVCFPAR